jgi:acyl-CoA reductase-like NAD-dependent aldehyde dehydrogenase
MGSAFTTAPAAAVDDVELAMRAADKAFSTWSTDEDARRRAMHAAAGAIDAAAPELAALLTAEQGKPLHEAATEVQGSALWLRYYAELGPGYSSRS